MGGQRHIVPAVSVPTMSGGLEKGRELSCEDGRTEIEEYVKGRRGKKGV